jgi:hypothetical protein
MTAYKRLDIDRAVFIGRTYAEYIRMFGLDEGYLREGPVLDCPAGPSSFTAEAGERGLQVTACDIVYGAPAGNLADKGREDIEHTFQKVDEVPHLYVWKYYRDRDEIISLRHRALERFTEDYASGAGEGRYVQAELPRLPFPDRAFNVVLSSHFLFLYGDRLSADFHVSSLREMVRVSSGEVRVYPLQGLDARPYRQMREVLGASVPKGSAPRSRQRRSSSSAARTGNWCFTDEGG